MPQTDPNKQSDFMIEKIKNRPVNKKKLLRRTITTAAMAVIFGLIACFTFLVLEPVFSNWLYPEEEPLPIVFPEESEEMAPEDMVVEEEPLLPEDIGNIVLEEDQIQAILDKVELDKDNYKQLYTTMSEYVDLLSLSMVTVTAVSSDVDWLNDTYESEGRTYGVIIATNGREYLILTEQDVIEQAEILSVTFHDGTQAIAVEKKSDSQTGLAVISVPAGAVSEDTLATIQVAALGSSNLKDPVGIPVVALGSPMGTVGSVGYGMVAASGTTLSLVDANYKLLTTDIYGSPASAGVLFNMQGQIMGIITEDRAFSDMDNAVTAIGISELRKLIENMSNNKEKIYMGISGTDVTVEAHLEMNVPYGAYVKDVEMNSPAMLAGIQRGDIIVEIDGSSVENFSNYTAALLQMEAGDTVTVVIQRLSQNTYREVELTITVEAGE
ncbi:MAG: PDZ domain-containing protein [Lachnospiraceae bacterium]|nr:PDZ domain-containing protein [Lachnospiraceae bacterium]